MLFSHNGLLIVIFIRDWYFLIKIINVISIEIDVSVSQKKKKKINKIKDNLATFLFINFEIRRISRVWGMTVSFLRETFQVYLGRSHFILRMGRLEYVGRFLFLLRLLVDHRFRRHRARWQNLRGPGSRFILHLLLHVSNAWWVATDLSQFYRIWRLMFHIPYRNPFFGLRFSFWFLMKCTH